MHLRTTKAQTSLHSLISAIVIQKFIEKYHIYKFCYEQNFNILASIWADWTEYHFVENPKDSFTRHARITALLFKLTGFLCHNTIIIAGHPSIKYPIHKHSKSSSQNGAKPM